MHPCKIENIACEKSGKYIILIGDEAMKKYSLVVLASILMILAACSSNSSSDGIETITFADAGWDSIRVHNEIAGTILEEAYGYETDVTTGSSAATLQGLRQGDINVFMEVWSYTNKVAYQKGIKAGDVKQVSTNFDDNSGGYWVPTYVIEGDPERGIEPTAPELETVADLKKYPDVFEDPEDSSKGRLIGAPSSWEISQIMEKKLSAYNLEDKFNYFRPGSDSAIVASLTDAYKSGEPWVGYYWSPTWVTSMYDMTLLKEPEYDEEVYKETAGTALPSEDVEIAVHTDVVEEAPKVVDFLSNYETSAELTGEALEYMKKNDASPEEAAIWWLNEHEDIWTKWIPKEKADQVKKAIQS